MLHNFGVIKQLLGSLPLVIALPGLTSYFIEQAEFFISIGSHFLLALTNTLAFCVTELITAVVRFKIQAPEVKKWTFYFSERVFRRYPCLRQWRNRVSQGDHFKLPIMSYILRSSLLPSCFTGCGPGVPTWGGILKTSKDILTIIFKVMKIMKFIEYWNLLDRGKHQTHSARCSITSRKAHFRVTL